MKKNDQKYQECFDFLIPNGEGNCTVSQCAMLGTVPPGTARIRKSPSAFRDGFLSRRRGGIEKVDEANTHSDIIPGVPPKRNVPSGSADKASDTPTAVADAGQVGTYHYSLGGTTLQSLQIL